jgi:uncharacterized protein YecT (DUF1311 family)
MRMMRWAMAAVSVLAATPTLAQPASDSGETAGLAQDLRDSDKRINAVYKTLMEGLDEAGKKSLRDAQRGWLKARDKECSLDTKESDREKWLQAILTDPSKTVCVVRYTYQRVTQLDTQLKGQANAPAADLPSAPQAPVLPPAAAGQGAGPVPAGLTYVDDGYALQSTAQRTTGKWYLELWVDPAGIAALGDVVLSPVFHSPEVNTGRMITIRRKQANAEPVTLGLAIDLDNGFVYMRVNGAWQNQPGQVSPLQVKLGRPYSFLLNGSSEVRELVRRGLIKVDLGDTPFRYAMPDGYRPYSGS